MISQSQGEQDAGDEVMKSIGKLTEATEQLKDENEKVCGPTAEETATFIGIVIRTILKVLGK